jgi:hypothetical protein
MEMTMAMAMATATATDERRRVEGEFRESPGMRLTALQASRFWQLGLEESRRLLDSLVATGTLRVTADGYYVKSS